MSNDRKSPGLKAGASASSRRVSNRLVALSSAAVLAVYSAGYLRTQAAADRFDAEVGQRRPVLPAPAPTLFGSRETPPPPAAPATASASAGGRATATASSPSPPPAAVVPTPAAVSPAPPAESTPPSKPLMPVASRAESASAARATTTTATRVDEAASEPKAAPEEARPAAQPVAPAAAPALPAAPATAVAASDAPAPSLPPPPAAPAAPRYKDGTFIGWGTSRHGDIAAQVVIANGRITSATIAECLTRWPCTWIEALPGQVVARQSPETDYVSGATQSTNAFYYAVVQALGKASLP